jgi:putative aldouronate transport system permease protein
LPYYVVIHNLHLFNSFWVYILPNGFWPLYMLIMRTYFDSLPASLEESAKLDGAGDMKIFLKIIIPLSMPIIATVAIFLGVAQWNSWFDAAVFVTKQKLQPLQLILQRMLLESSTLDFRSKAMNAGNTQSSTESMRMSTLVITTLPIVVIYPFFQKYFIKGVMIGAVKA